MAQGIRNNAVESSNPSQVDDLGVFHPAVREWFQAVFPSATRPQKLGWPAIARGESTLILAPTGTGKTLAAFLWCIDRLMFGVDRAATESCRVVYISPIKALAVDVERNLQAPLVGVAHAAKRLGLEFRQPSIAMRTGDTPSQERARFNRHPADILITTPESLYLLLTSNASDALRSVEVVIVDEIHALVPSKRGSHLALSLERLEYLRGRSLQRIGLSATQRPLEEVARFLGGAQNQQADPEPRPPELRSEEEPLAQFESASQLVSYRPVTIIDASEPKKLELRVEVPVEDMSSMDEIDLLPSGPASQAPARPSIWSAIHPKLLEEVRSHSSTIIFVNNRRLAERISGAINELAGETLVRAHHGSISADQRKDIEDRLKLGTLKGLVATSSLELGIDMGAVDLVIQIESPPSVASGMQRVGRANHRVGAVSSATIFPKYRADLVACAAVTRAMYDGQVEVVRYPRNALDVLAQHIVAMVAMEPWQVSSLYNVIRKAAPYAALTRSVFDGVLDMLSGRYPSDEFAELRPRLTWDRLTDRLTSREGARRVAVVNGGTIPDRGLYGVFLTGASKGARVGELDEEMVFESRTGDTIILGASTWRVEEISHNRVLVSPAPGEPGRMPFWKGGGLGRPAEFGRRIGKLIREVAHQPRNAALAKLTQDHSLDSNAAENLLSYLEEQRSATGRIPSDKDVVIEICRDELGDRRVCVLTPFGTPVHSPWCMAVTAKMRTERNWEVESMWTDDGFVIRLPDNEEQIDSELILPSPDELKDLVLQQLGSTSLFAAKFRESAARALLLPRRRPGMRTPLWQQRKRAADLLAVASRFSSFPILLETYRECVRDVFDLPSTLEVLSDVRDGRIQVTALESDKPSPFASSLLFSYVANYIYDGDAPLAERRAQALSIDQSQLEELLGDTDLRELLDPAALDEIEARLQLLDPEYRARHADGVHDLLLKLGDLNAEEIEARSSEINVSAVLSELTSARRIVAVRIAESQRYIPVEYASRYRDALGVPLPPGLAQVFLERTEHPLNEIVRRYARVHGPFTSAEVASRYGLQIPVVEQVLRAMHSSGKLLEGEFRPNGRHREWCDPQVLQQIRRKSLAKLRREVEPVEQRVLARLSTRWQGVTVRRKGLDALLDTVEIVQGAALLASDLEREIIPSRIADYTHNDLDTLIAAGEVVWTGVEQVGDRDGRIALYLKDSVADLMPPEETRANAPAPSERAAQIIEFLSRSGASFFSEIHAACGGGYPGETLSVIWELVWSGRLTNDTFQPMRHRLRPPDASRNRITDPEAIPGSPSSLKRFRSRSTEQSGAASGRWSLIKPRSANGATNATVWSANTAKQLLTRYGIVMRETALAENIPGGYNTVYPALRTMEDSGLVRRGMFVAGLGAAQFASNSAVDLLRSLRTEPSSPEVVHVAAADPANPYGASLPWPRPTNQESDTGAPHAMSRTAGASVILINGYLTAFLRRKNPSLKIFLPEMEPEKSSYAREVSRKLAELAIRRQTRRTGLLIGEINGEPARNHFLSPFLEEAGFVKSAMGFQMRRTAPIALQSTLQRETEIDEDDDQQPAESA